MVNIEYINVFLFVYRFFFLAFFRSVSSFGMYLLLYE